MAPVDEAVFLLHTAAEVEHALLVQYLYAAYSLDVREPATPPWRDTIRGIAREEMAHLVSVQNVLLALGGPLNFERQDATFRQFYPFALHLRPLSLKSAARYVLAEMPDISIIPADLGFDLVQVRHDAGVDDDSEVINRVGLLYDRLIQLVGQLAPSDFHQDSLAWQAKPEEWSASTLGLIIRTVETRDDATRLLADIGAQGEGPTEPAGGQPSHFRRFYAIYRQLRDSPVAYPAFSLPNDPSASDPDAPGYLQNKEARLSAALLDVRYRMLLAQLEHYLGLRDDIRRPSVGRRQLRRWCHEEMTRHLTKLTSRLTELPQHEPPMEENGRVRLAGPPFELPASLSLPKREIDRWRHHRMLIETSARLSEALRSIAGDPALAEEIRLWDEQRRTFIDAEIVAAFGSNEVAIEG